MFSLRRTAAVMAMAVLTVGVGASAAAAEKIGGAAGNGVETSDVSAAATHGRIPPRYSSCPRGNFCAWVLSDAGGVGNQGGYRWTGSDADWRNNIVFTDSGFSINNADRSWANHGTSCAGCDHVRVYAGLNYSNARTICLAPGQRLDLVDRPAANDRGSSHSWWGSC